MSPAASLSFLLSPCSRVVSPQQQQQQQQHTCAAVCLQVSFYIPLTANEVLVSTVSRDAPAPVVSPAAGKQRIGSVLGEPTHSSPMSKFNNRFSFYMLMFCGTGTIFNLALLNFGKWGV